MFFFENFGRFQSGCDSLKESLALARRWAPTLKPVMIIGETGTGKKEMALEIISLSSRSAQHVTRWTADMEGMPETSYGTILIENLEAFSKAQQQIVLSRIGNSLGDRAMESPRWIVTACRDILSWVRRGEILPALFQVLVEQCVIMPSIQDRLQDIEPIVNGFVANLNEVFQGQKRISASSHVRLKSLKYEKNWLSLFDRVEKAYMSAEGPLIDLTHFGFQEVQISTAWAQAGLSLSEMERRLIVQTLEMTQQNRTKAAEILGISIRTLRNKLNEYREVEAS